MNTLTDEYWRAFGYTKAYGELPSDEFLYRKKRMISTKTYWQCDKCLKWRHVTPTNDMIRGESSCHPSDTWSCEQNTTAGYTTCAAQQTLPDYTKGELTKSATAAPRSKEKAPTLADEEARVAAAMEREAAIARNDADRERLLEANKRLQEQLALSQAYSAGNGPARASDPIKRKNQEQNATAAGGANGPAAASSVATANNNGKKQRRRRRERRADDASGADDDDNDEDYDAHYDYDSAANDTISMPRPSRGSVQLVEKDVSGRNAASATRPPNAVPKPANGTTPAAHHRHENAENRAPDVTLLLMF